MKVDTAPLRVTKEMLGIQEGEAYEGPLEIDVGNLTAYDPSPVDPQAFSAHRDRAQHELSTKMTQSLFNVIFTLPSESAAPDPGRIAHLPPPTTPLPREKPLPKPRPPTKWEKFAQLKGITKKKKSKEVFDEESGEYKRRYGYKRINDINEIPVIDAKEGDYVGFDPFSELVKEKKERVKKNKEAQLANLKKTAKIAGKSALPPTIALASSLEGGRGNKKRAHLRDDIQKASLLSGVSTASMGKFDRLLRGEKPEERKLPTKRKKKLPVSDRTGLERSSIANIVGRIVREKSDDIFDADRAATGLERERRQERSKEKIRQVAAGGVEKKKFKGKRHESHKATGKKNPGAKMGKKMAMAKSKEEEEEEEEDGRRIHEGWMCLPIVIMSLLLILIHQTRHHQEDMLLVLHA